MFLSELACPRPRKCRHQITASTPIPSRIILLLEAQSSDRSDQVNPDGVDANPNPPYASQRKPVQGRQQEARAGRIPVAAQNGNHAALAGRIAQYQQLRDACSLCWGTVEAKMRLKAARDTFQRELEAAGVNIQSVGAYRWHHDEMEPPAALRVRFAKKAILEDYT